MGSFWLASSRTHKSGSNLYGSQSTTHLQGLGGNSVHVLPGVGSNSLGHLDDVRLDEKKNLGLSLNEKKKKTYGPFPGGSDKEAHFHSVPGKFFSRWSYPTMERTAQTKMSSPLRQVFNHWALNG